MEAEESSVQIKGAEYRFGDVIAVTLDGGRTFVGALIGFDPADESPSGRDEVEIAEELFIRALQVDEISSIEKVA